MQGQVGEFNYGDIQLAFTIDGVSTSTIPQSGNYEVSITCDNGATGTWDYDEWGPNIRNVTASKVKCSIDFVKARLCRRATSLHTEMCSQSDTSAYCGAGGYSSGDTITYGSLGTSGTLTTGDAFDCDVDGDGTYNAETERFYYVSDYYDTSTNEYNSEYATLIYYNNVSGGVANNTAGYAYYADSSNAYGPATAVLQLPTTTQWSNVSLINTARSVQYETGTIRVTRFNYSGYASRLLTYQEIKSGCYDGTTGITAKGGLSSKCQFLLENTKYSTSSLISGYWLENVLAYASYNAWDVAGNHRSVSNTTLTDTVFNGVRPAIEVAKTDINY